MLTVIAEFESEPPGVNSELGQQLAALADT
jgi:hypothetical protein